MKVHKPLKGFIHSIRRLHLDRILIEFVELSMQHILKYYLPNSKNTFFNKLLSKYIYHFQCLILIFFAITYFSDIDMHDISGYTVGTQYLNNLQISSAEMTQYLCNIKMSHTSCITKKYRVPFFNYVLTDKIVMKYMNRPVTFKSLTLTGYLR